MMSDSQAPNSKSSDPTTNFKLTNSEFSQFLNLIFFDEKPQKQ
jgi:hypothetical protein